MFACLAGQAFYLIFSALMQVHVLELVKQGRNIFFTGNAGTGELLLGPLDSTAGSPAILC